MKKNLKQNVQDAIKKNLSEEGFLRLEEMENVEGGACALGCVPGCLLSDLKAVDLEQPETPEN